jgi:hypothetical protein
MKDYLFESKYPGGTYASLILSEESKEELFAYCNSLGIDNLVTPDEYHCTLLYSKVPCHDIAKEDFDLPCKAMIVGFKILGVEIPVLVAELYCPNALRLHDKFIEEYDATHDYPEYIPHITIADEYTGDIPDDIPEFDIEFEDKVVEKLE